MSDMNSEIFFFFFWSGPAAWKLRAGPSCYTCKNLAGFSMSCKLLPCTLDWEPTGLNPGS